MHVEFLESPKSKLEKTMPIELTVSQKDVLLQYFKDDIKLAKVYIQQIPKNFKDEFTYRVFKDLIFTAAKMFQETDLKIFNESLLEKFKTIKALDQKYVEFKNANSATMYINTFLEAQSVFKETQERYEKLKSESGMLIAQEKALFAEVQEMENKMKACTSKKEAAAILQELKPQKKKHVDTLHRAGQLKDLQAQLYADLHEFEELHKNKFFNTFNVVFEKLDKQYNDILNFVGYTFNELLFECSEKSRQIQKFKQNAGIPGRLDICTFLDYQLRNTNINTMTDQKKKEMLNEAKKYCRKKRLDSL